MHSCRRLLVYVACCAFRLTWLEEASPQYPLSSTVDNIARPHAIILEARLLSLFLQEADLRRDRDSGNAPQ